MEAIRGHDPASRVAALRLLPEFKQREANQAFASLLPKADPVTQVAVLQGLSYRGAFESAAEMAELLRSPDLTVRIATASALADTGGAGAGLVACGVCRNDHRRGANRRQRSLAETTARERERCIAEKGGNRDAGSSS